MKIIIYGFMSSGKTTVGKIISEKLGMKFYDTDEIISKKFKKSVYDLIKSRGIKSFRIEEKKLIKKLINKNEICVISVGGGVFPLRKKRDDIVEFFINTPYKILKKRFNKAKETRPILKKLIKKPKKLLELYRKRLKFYKEANFIIKSNNSYNAAKKIIKIYETINNINNKKNYKN